jgi:hypothetical protein
MAVAAWVLAIAACGGVGRGDDGATKLARRWAAAIAADDPRAAYELLASSVRGRRSYEAFARAWRDSRAERERQARALESSMKSGGPIAEQAAITVRDGQKALLDREPEGWRLLRPLLAAVRPATPEEALERLAAALDERSFPAVLRLLSSERQEAARHLLEAMSSGIRDHQDELVEVAEDRATLVWTDGSRRWRIVLKREDGAWRIHDFSVQ